MNIKIKLNFFSHNKFKFQSRNKIQNLIQTLEMLKTTILLT